MLLLQENVNEFAALANTLVDMQQASKMQKSSKIALSNNTLSNQVHFMQ
jgi:hypothetical protein